MNLSKMSKLRNGQTSIPFWDLDKAQRRRGKRDVVRGNCVITNKPHTITVYSDELDKWLTGNCLIQDALITDVSADDREFLMTGISPEGWETIFPKTGMSSLVGDEIK